MGLVRIECENCKTIYYGNTDSSKEDGYCYLCSTTRKFLKMFDLTDIPISEVDFNRVRVPQFKELYIDEKDWRNYIPQGLKDMWYKLPVESRMLAIMFAEREARAVDIISDGVVGMIKKEES